MASMFVLGLYLVIVIFADFLAPYSATARDRNYVKGRPEIPWVWDGGPALPGVDAAVTQRGGQDEGFAYRRVEVDQRQTIHWFVKGEPWSVFGLFEVDRRLFGVPDVEVPAELLRPVPVGAGGAEVAAASEGSTDGSAVEAAPDPDDPFASVERGDGGGLVIGGISGGAAEDESPQAGDDPASGGAATAGPTEGADGESTGTAAPASSTETIPGFVHLLGTDDLGRDQFSRILYATRTSLTIGLAGLFTSFILGLFFGGIAGYAGGIVDTMIQRLIEVVRSIPTIPLVMGLAAAFPQDWSNLRVFFFTSLILGMVGWTTLARRIRTMLLTLRDEDFVVAARLAGAGPFRIVVRHMLPSFFSYIVVTLAIEFPYMILAESVLSFVGLGLRPPTVSWGVLLQEAQKVEVLEQTPWLLAPGVFVVVAVLAFNFIGDGLRDAADPYQESS